MKLITLLVTLVFLSDLAEAQTFESVPVAVGEWPDIVIDGSSRRVISYIKEFPPSIIWVATEGLSVGQFEIEEVAQTRVHGPTQIVLDHENRIRLGIHDHNFEGFSQWIQGASSWVFDAVESTGHDGWDPD